MPVTGNMEQEHSTLESMEQLSFVDSGRMEQTADSSGAEVSSTTTDSDFVSQTSQDVKNHEDSVSEHVQSTSADVQSTSADVLLDSVDGLKHNIAPVNESVSKSSSANSGLGFQDAFAAFASASYREAQDESPVDVCKDFQDATSDTAPQAITPSTSDRSNFSVVDSCVSSAIDSGHVTTTAESFVTSAAETETLQSDTTGNESHPRNISYPETDNQSTLGVDPSQTEEQITQTPYNDSQMDTTASSESVYFIQTTDASGQVVTSIIDPNDIPSYTDSVVYKQCMRADGEIETIIVYSPGMVATQEQPTEQAATTSEETSESQHQIIYAHDINGHLTPIDSTQSFNDVAPPGKQFVYMQDSTGRIIRTIMDADQTMVPGQQVYYTQSDDGRIITSVMDPAIAGESDEPTQSQHSQDAVDQAQLQQLGDTGAVTQQQETGLNMMAGTSNFNIDNNMSGLTMLAELSHLTAGQAYSASGLPSEHRAASSSTDSSSVDQDEFRPIATVTRPAMGDEGLESVSSDIADLKVGQEETLITKIMSQIGEEALTVSRDNLFVQWQNLDAMCWMDVVLIMLVNSPSLRPLVNLDPSQELSSTLLLTLLKANRQAQILLQNILKKSNCSEVDNLQTGAGNATSIQDPKASTLVCKANMDEIGKAINILYAMREKIWQALQPRLRCERGKHNSPVLVLPLIIREKPAIKQLFTMDYRYVFKCKLCEYSQDDRQTKILPSIPAVPDDFNMQAPCFVRNCFECSAPDQRMFMKFEVLHDFVQMHFVKGLPHNRFDELSFDFNGDHYEVTAVVHYKNNPDHFIAWVRNAPGLAWMECDDLKSVITCYSDVSPNIPPAQVHMVMWERRLTSQHTLVLRETDDTKLLASLVLTVQQPNSQQSADPAAARASGVPATSTSTPATSSSQPNLAAGTLTSTAASTLRPKGRFKGRGSFAGRGQTITTNTPIIRRVTQALAQLPSTSSPNSVSPQIIRLPLSALASSGLNLRGGTSPGARYVLVGNSSQTTNPARTPPVSKVVVVRSQGGAANISAAQLLQLLQRTGAISQSGARITTTVTTSGANSSSTTEPSTATYIIQQDGTVVAAPANAGLNQTSSGTSTVEPSSEQQGTTTADLSENKQIKSSQTISTLPYAVPTANLRGHMPTADAIIHHPQPSASSSRLEPMTISSDDAETPVEQARFAGQSVSISQNQQPTRYIQVPNPAGGMLLCQLGMKDGKTVLVPVEKTAHMQASGTSILKLSATASSSSPQISFRVPTTSLQTSTSSLAQIQQQMLQGHGATLGTTPGHHIITVPGTAGSKKIQLITVPHGTSPSQTNPPGSKTIIVSGQQTATTSSIITRLVSSVQTSLDSRVPSQSGKIAIRELKQTGQDNVTMSSLATAGHGVDTSLGPVMSTQNVSVLKHVPTRLATSGLGLSLLTSPTKLQKSPENFRYILPGSNTTHILHTGSSTGMTGQAGRAFTALSASGTIIGGQLTPSPTFASVETSPMDQDLADSDDNDSGLSLLTSRPEVSRELDTTEYIPLGPGRGKARAQRGLKGRGDRTPVRSQLWTSEADLIAPVSASSHKISTLADLRQIGAHVIDSGSETVDGVPVVSIPDFSTDRAGQREILSAAQSIISENASGMTDQGTSHLSDSSSQVVMPVGELQTSAALSKAVLTPPRVITQQIPSYRHNHGYDILTQGILGANTSRSPSLRQARSLLTGATTTLPSTSTLVSSSLLESASPLMLSATSTEQQAMGQAEIDTLIQAAHAAAKPPTPGSLPSVQDMHPVSTSIIRGQQSGIDFAAGNIIKLNNISTDLDVDITQIMSAADSMTIHPSQEGQDGGVVNIDESHVSAAERYQMPVELFQPDEGSPQKSVRGDDAKLAVDLPSNLGDAKTGITKQEAAKSHHKKKRRGTVRRPKRKSGNVYKKVEPQTPEEIIVESGRDEPIVTAEPARLENAAFEEPTRDEASMEVEPPTGNDNLLGVYRNVNSELSSQIDNSTTTSGHFKPIDVSAVLLPATEETAEDLPVKKVNRHQKRSRGRKRKQGSRNKPIVDKTTFSDISSPLSDTSPAVDIIPVVTPDSSPERKTPFAVITIETQSLQHSPDSSPVKYFKENSASTSFSSDLLLQKSDDERELLPADVETSTDIIEENHQKAAAVELNQTQQTLSLDTGSQKHTFAPAFVRYRKEKVNWDIETETVVWPQPESFFNYKVLTGRSVRSDYRHPSLPPASESYISEPTSLTIKPPKKVYILHEPLSAVVVTRSPRPRQKPNSDPTREPSVIPLVMEDNCDPSCMGGSVVTSLDGAEMFTGVVVRHKRERTNWSTSMDEEEDVLENETGEELKAVQREFCSQLQTVLYMHAGDFSAAVNDISDEEDEEITVFKEEMAENISEEEKTEFISGEDISESTFRGDKAVSVSGEDISESISREEMTEKFPVPQEEAVEGEKSDVIGVEKQDELLTDVGGEKQAELLTDVVGEKQAELLTDVAGEKQAELLTDVVGEKQAELLTDVGGEKQAELLTDVVGEKQAELLTDVGGEKQAELLTDVVSEKQAEPLTDVVAENQAELLTDVVSEKQDEPLTDVGAENQAELLTDVVGVEKQDEPLTDVVGTGVFLDNLHTNTASSLKGRKNKRKPSGGLASKTRPPKKVRISSDGESDSSKMGQSHPTNCPAADTTDASLAVVSSRVNGVDTISSPGHSSQTSGTGYIQQKDRTTTAQKPLHSPPSRRSGRTPVPSRKFLDAWEEYPVRGPAFVDRQILPLSSEEEPSGLSGSEMPRKKQKTKKTFSSS